MLGMDSHNTLVNLNTVAIVIMLIQIRFILGFILLVINYFCKSKTLDNLKDYLLKDIMWNQILTIAIETYADLCIVLLLNFYGGVPDYSYFGECLGLALSFCIGYTLVIILPYNLIWLLLADDEDLEK